MQFLFTNKPVFEALNQFWGTVESKKLVLDPKQPIPTFNEVKYILLGEAENGSVPYNVDSIVENKSSKLAKYFSTFNNIRLPTLLITSLLSFMVLPIIFHTSESKILWVSCLTIWCMYFVLAGLEGIRYLASPILNERGFKRDFRNHYSKKYVEAVYVWLDANGHTEHREGNNETIDAKLQDSHSLASTIMNYESTPLPFMVGAKQTGFVTSEKPNTLIISFTN